MLYNRYYVGQVVKLANTTDSKSVARKSLRVQLPPCPLLAPPFMSRHKLPDKNFDWSTELAYIVGLLTTDGNLSNDGRHINMRSSDLQLLNTFKKCLHISNKIAQTHNDGFAKRPCYRIQFGNVQFYRWLLKIGLFPNKTYTIRNLRIPNLYFRDFLRGHLDGDGSITTYKDYYNTFKNPEYVYIRLWLVFISVSKMHMQWIRNTIYKLTLIHGHIYCTKPRASHQVAMWRLKYAKNDSIKLLQWIYYKRNLPCLRRKREIADKVLNLLRKQKRKKYTKQK